MALTFALLIVILLVVPPVVFALLSERKPKSTLSTRKVHIDSVKGIVLFVSAIRPDQDLQENLLAYKIMKHISDSNPENLDRRYIWLIHGETLNERNSSYWNTNELYSEFSPRNEFTVVRKGIHNINDLTQTFEVVEEIFSFELPKYNLRESDVICDITSGTKTMSTGMVLACMGGRRLVYFPQGDTDRDMSEFIEINTKSLLDAVVSSSAVA